MAADFGRGGFSGRGRGGFNQDSEGSSQNPRGAFGGRGAFNQASTSGDNPRGSYGGGRGGFNQDSEGSRGNFSGRGRGGFNQDSDGNNQNARGGGFSGGRGGCNQGSESGQNARGSYGGGRGGRGDLNQDSEGSRGNFSGRGRGGFNQESEGSSQNARGAFGGRGGYNQASTSGDNPRGNYGGGRGDFNQDSEGGRGGFSGRGRGGFNQDSDGNNQNARGGGFSGPRGGYNQEGGRGNFSGARGGFNQGSEDNNQNARGNFSGRGRGGFNQDSDGNNQNARGGGFSGGRGGCNQDLENGQNARGNYGGGRGGFNQESDGGRGGFSGRGRGGFNQESEDGQNTLGGYGAGRGRGGNRNFGDQENQGGAFEGRFTQSRTGADAPAPNYGEEGEAAQPERAPMNFVPKTRDLEQLYKEDEESAAAYAECFELDDDVNIENAKCEVVRIQNWEEADFDPQLLENVKVRSKYSRPRKIQGAAIPFILDHFDVKAQAETGSGKTAAFVLPIIDTCIKAKKSQGPDRFESELATPFAIIIGPTRELVLQVYEQAQKFANGTGVTVAKAYGQYNINRNHEEIRGGCDILVGTVGRLKHFILNEDIFVHKLRYLVLDEADRLLDQNFVVDIEAITNAPRFPPKERRITMLFSATFDASVMDVADRMLRPDAVFITNQRNDPNKKIKQDFVLLTSQKSRLDVLAELLKEELDKVGASQKMRRTLVFVNTKRMSDMAALYLCQHGIPAVSINGDRGQHLREQALSDFRNHVVSVLISTDVTARGIDVKQLDHVINFDLPTDSITYVHRIGRTGRITQGFATTFIDGSEPILIEIANMLRKMGPLPETLEKVINGGNGMDAAVSSNFAFAAAPQSQPAAAPVHAGNDW